MGCGNDSRTFVSVIMGVPRPMHTMFSTPMYLALIPVWPLVFIEKQHRQSRRSPAKRSDFDPSPVPHRLALTTPFGYGVLPVPCSRSVRFIMLVNSRGCLFVYQPTKDYITLCGFLLKSPRNGAMRTNIHLCAQDSTSQMWVILRA